MSFYTGVGTFFVWVLFFCVYHVTNNTQWRANAMTRRKGSTSLKFLDTLIKVKEKPERKFSEANTCYYLYSLSSKLPSSGQSFLDAMFQSLAIDPIDGFQLLDGTALLKEDRLLKSHTIIGQVSRYIK
jgi:hypothetical protein